MSFGDHLEELRWRLILALAAPLPLAIVLFFVSRLLVDLLLRPLFRVLEAHNLPVQVQVLSPPEFLMTQLKLSILGALILAAPWILWQAWKFISPGLYQHEKRFVYLLVPGSTVLTIAGIALLYFIMLPLMLHVLVMFGGAMREEPPEVAPIATEAVLDENATTIELREDDPETVAEGQMWLKMPERVLNIAINIGTEDSPQMEVLQLRLSPPLRVAQQFRVSEYIGFVLLLLAGIVIAFQLPLVIVLAGWIGLVQVDWLRRQRKYALLLCAVVSAVITPADAISMIMMLIPLYALFELGILLLVIAPASRVARGTVLTGDRSHSADSSDKGARRAARTDEPAESSQFPDEDNGHSGVGDNRDDEPPDQPTEDRT